MYKKVLLFFWLLSFGFCAPAFSKTVMFLVHTETIGGKGVYELYQEMKKDGHDVKIVAIPSYNHEEFLLDIDTNFTQKFDPKDVIYPCGKSSPYKSCESLEKYNPDYIFIQNPYESYSSSILDPYYLTSNLKKYGAKVAYIVYGPHLFHQDFINDTNLPNLLDVVFVDSESTKDIFIKRLSFPSDKVKVSGYATYKEIRDKLVERPSSKKETILWLPRWSLSFRNRDLYESGSTFLNYHQFFYNFAKNNPNINFIFRPHYSLFSYAVKSKFLDQTDVDDILNKFRSLPNVTVSNHNERPLVEDVLASDVVISDGSSALAEVVVADKPIIYMSNGVNNEFNSNDLSKQFKNYLYYAYEPSDILYNLEQIRKDNYHPFTVSQPVTFKDNLKTYVKYILRTVLNQPRSRDEFKARLDPVENPVAYISQYVSEN
jgi:hypothetical protein